MRILLLFIASLTLPFSAQPSNHLLAGETLNTSRSLYQGFYNFIIQDDCNLVLYYDTIFPVWDSGTSNQGSYCYVTMQNNGILVVYDISNKVIWTSNTSGEIGDYVLILQRDGKVVIYGAPIWAKGTNMFGLTGVVIASTRNGTMLPYSA